MDFICCKSGNFQALFDNRIVNLGAIYQWLYWPYLAVYGKYLSILNQFKTKDEKFRKQKIDELQKKIPILYKSKIFKRTILNEIENRILLNPDLMKEARKKLEDSSFFITLLEMDEYSELKEDLVGVSLSPNPFSFSPHFYVQYCSTHNRTNQHTLASSGPQNHPGDNQWSLQSHIRSHFLVLVVLSKIA